MYTGDYVCDGMRVTFIFIFYGVRTMRFQIQLPSIRYRCFIVLGVVILCVFVPLRTHLQDMLIKSKFRWL